MTLKDGLYYCDICKDKKSIPKGKGFSFPPNPLGIDHAHQSCYNKYYEMGKQATKNMSDADIAKLKEQWDK
jgi:hypothetical protein